MAPRRSAAEEVEEEESETELVALQFNESLTWRPGKPIPLDKLLKHLNTLAKELEELDQEVIDPNSLTKVAKEVASHQILSHKDKGVRAYAACCVVDILRLCAPDAPFTPTQMKDIFNLAVTSIIPTLFDPSNPYNTQHKYVLRSLTEIKSVALLLDVDGSDNLLLALFSNIFDGVSGVKSASGEQVAKDVEFSMAEMLGVLIDEATTLPAKVVDIIMAQFLRAAAPGAGRRRRDHVQMDDNQATLLAKEEPEAYQIAKNLCQTFPDKMSRLVSQYFSDVIVDATSFAARPGGHKDADDEEDDDGPSGPSESDLQELDKAHTLIRELWKAAPQVLQNVVPQVDAELSADNVHLRQLATETLGDMISGIGAAGPPPAPVLDPAAYPPLSLDAEGNSDSQGFNILTKPLSAISFPQTHSLVFHNFLSRKNDKASTIRAAWTTAVGHILSTSAGGIGLSREDEATLIQGLGEKLSDSDEKVRLAAVKAIESFGFRDVVLKLGPSGGVSKEGSILSTLADRCRDRRPAVRVAAMTLLGNLWAVGTGELLAGNEAVIAALEGVPSRIYNAFYANDAEVNALLDRVIFESLIPLTYPPPKKGSKSANGSSQSQAAAAAAADADAIRAERILLLVRSLDPMAKKAFFAMQARQPQFAQILETYIKQCELFNGGVMDDNAEKKQANLNKTVQYIAQFLPNPAQSVQDLLKFAKVNDRRNRALVRYIIGQEQDFKTVNVALKELNKRINGAKETQMMDTLLSLLYRSGRFIFNRSHLATIMEYSKSNKDGLGGAAHEVLNEISQRNPDLFKTHIGQLCKDLVDQAPTENRENDPSVAETLKACSTYARKYPKDVPMDRDFVQTLVSFALFGQPPKVAKHAVNILLSKQDNKSTVYAKDLLQRILKDWTYGSKHFLNKLSAVSQLELLAPKITQDAEDKILGMIQDILLEVRTEAKDSDPEWVDDSELDEECEAKCLALKTLANRLRSMDAEEAKENGANVWKMLIKLIRTKGEMSKTKNTPKHHKSRLRLLAAQLILKLCIQKHFDDLLTPEDFNALALTTQDAAQEVRHGFVRTLQKYLVDDKLRARFYTMIFLMAFEPNTEFKQRTETWIRSRARHYASTKQYVLEAVLGRLFSLLAHHPDYSSDPEELVDHARYILFYVSLVATEANLGLLSKYAERAKQTQDALNPESTGHRVLCDLTQAVIRKWQEKKNWTFNAWPEKIGLPKGLYAPLKSHSEAQEIAEKLLVPDAIDEKLDDLLRAMDRKKKRKSTADGNSESRPAAKKSRVQPKEPKIKEARKIATPKPKKPSRPKKAPSSPKVSAISDANRRRSGRSVAQANQSYIERDSSEDDEEMLDGVAEWEYEDGNGEEASGDEAEGENGSDKKKADESGSELSEHEEVEEEDKEEEADVEMTDDKQAEEEGEEPEEEADDEKEEEAEPEAEAEEEEEEEAPPPTKANGRRGRSAPKEKAKPAPKEKSAPAVKKQTALPTRTSGRATRGRAAA
ncbi:putative sister chromatid cohesion protein PDS5 [Triangularia verruculosa]|uniref:Sister chromatid cohesion protein PDS5 n=1 Tax=Triangularia verruculosa TaxID=2587418 RepID=A0AAN7AT56_9PEZI|nr:putative sister chromatid cohesion protein PDS5 [Triangularia verruculosa]